MPVKAIQKVLILVAMEAEAAPLIAGLGLTKDIPSKIQAPAPCITFSGTFADLHVSVVCNGKCRIHGVDNVGTVPAAITAYLALQTFAPDLAISAGTAGGFKSQGAAIGDIFIGTSTVNHDRRIPISGFDLYGHWAYDGTPAPNLRKALNLKEGVVSSGNSMDYVKEDMDNMQRHNAAVKEMEAAGIAWSAHLFGTPFFALKSITDIVDGDRPAQEEFLENLSAAAKSLHDTLGPVLQFISGKAIDQL